MSGTKLKLQQTSPIMKVKYWVGLARWWVALRVMPKKQRRQTLFYFQFWRNAQATLRGPIFTRLEKSAAYAVRSEKTQHGKT